MSGHATNGQSTNGRAGFSGTSLVLMFAGGALVGAVTAHLAQAQNRARVRALVNRTGETAGNLPQAVRKGSHAVKEAFAEAYGGDGEAASIKHEAF